MFINSQKTYINTYTNSQKTYTMQHLLIATSFPPCSPCCDGVAWRHSTAPPSLSVVTKRSHSCRPPLPADTGIRACGGEEGVEWVRGGVRASSAEVRAGLDWLPPAAAPPLSPPCRPRHQRHIAQILQGWLSVSDFPAVLIFRGSNLANLAPHVPFIFQ